ncbi:LacI family DNA-binding transcriptional regulator [Nocardiopsis sediminis]|uniref:LacI family DNA-binding transcriptional regulator n=1 Tax=Nocardiopsis sediminis TaxID=1778267 RepID=A0ABV8FPL9_9ACTN
MVKLSDVARLAGVGVGTASRAISGNGAVSPESRRRVLAAAEELGYRPNAAARALRERRTRAVGLLLPDIVNEFYTASAAVIQSDLDDAGYQLVVGVTGNDPRAERHAVRTMLDRQVDGLIHVPVDPHVELPADLPAVQLNRHSDPLRVSAVVSDDVAGVGELTSAVIGAGHTDLVAVIGAPEFSTSRDRLAGYRRAVAAAGIPEAGAAPAERPAAGRRSRVLTGPFTSQWGYDALTGIAGDRPQALIALSSRLMMGVLRACGDLGLRIPEDISVAGLGDPEWFSVWRPGITTFAPALADMGHHAATEVLRAIEEGPAAGAPRLERLPGRVRVRGSVQGLGAAPAPV